MTDASTGTGTETNAGTETSTDASRGPGTRGGVSQAVAEAVRERSHGMCTIPTEYQGYPDVAFGGYVAGLLAGCASADTVRVDFRAATPVGVPLRLAELDGGGALLTGRADAVLATATPAPAVSVADVPPAPSLERARAATEAFHAGGLTGLAVDGTSVDCFGCGHRPPDRGLRQHCARVPGSDLVATAWTPHPAFADARGLLRAEVLWAVLDCPTAWAGIHVGTLRPGAVTASLTATLLRPVAIGEDHITYAWPTAATGRKHTMGVAVATARGELCAVGEALWIDPRPRATGGSAG
ncbi:PaaI family thioesterase [Streptomyces sp. NPDC017988]|uniref:PaaI family thioesterase n=1 Tax=Streptomyces sp. NPDC017988 TaxID=3365025 RepID=UPI0037B44B0C